MANRRSFEENTEDLAKRQLGKTKYFTKTEAINSEIETALRKAPSKNGGGGSNYPDIKMLIETPSLRRIPVMIECKGKKGDLVKLNEANEIANIKKDGTPNNANITKYAVNGAIHYANAILDFSTTYKEVIAVGVNGYEENGSFTMEVSAYYVSLKNSKIPKKIGEYVDISFLKAENNDALIKVIDSLSLTEEEREAETKKIENTIETSLKALNQIMHDELDISVSYRVNLITGMIMAGLGVKGTVAPLEISELKGELGKTKKDGHIIINQISAFLAEKELPEEKKKMIINLLENVFLSPSLSVPVNGESKLKTVYSYLKRNILPYFESENHIDFTGKLFNVLNDWVDVPDGAKNDVVLTPRYVTEFMAKLCQVNMNSYVWDYAVGTAGFLISSMKLMIKDAEKKISSPEERKQKIKDIKTKQLLGIEKLPDIYLLAVLNMILMGDGSSNIIQENSLTEYSGNYEQGELKDRRFPANVFLLNPPYSADGKGFVFVKKALSRMQNGKAAILIQENAGSINGLPYTKELLENNTLLASIHMSDIFRGKSNVQTAVYLFDVGIPHDVRKKVKFIDFSKDGYLRQNRKKSGQNVNLRNVDHANERYEEVVNLVLFGKEHLHYLTENDYIEDVISLEGNDWTFAQHKKIDIVPTEADFMKTVSEYLAWKVSQLIKEGNDD